ncbi:SH3 domain-containing protein, partial [Chitinivorax sp. B]|uniref:SH3 domain-containing protein n=1 Tax=Chitinivorax sp. B TaxID=2502235 RepID=UPI0010F846BF
PTPTPTPTPTPSKQVTVQSTSADRPVNVRSAPTLNSTILGTVRHGNRINIVCHSYGDWVQGVWGWTRLWNKLSSGQWISDGFLDTGSNDPVVPACRTAR